MNSKIDSRFDSNDIKLDRQSRDINELKNEIQEMNKHVENNNEIIRSSLNKLEQSVERMEVVAMNTEKNKTNENYSDKCKNTIPDKHKKLILPSEELSSYTKIIEELLSSINNCESVSYTHLVPIPSQLIIMLRTPT